MLAGEILIKQITSEMALYIPIILLIFGSCGCLCNFITFTSKQLKKSSCAFYFLCTAIIELPTFYFGLLSRLANDRLGSTLFTTNPFYCKIRSYLIVTLPSLVTYTILLSAIDRYMSTKSQVYYRSFSQLKVAYRATPIVILMTMMFSSHMLIFFNFYPACTAQPGLYAIIYSVYLILWTGVLPNGLILLFSLLTYRNARQTKRRVLPSSHSQQPRHSQRTESQLIAVGSSLTVLCNSPFACSRWCLDKRFSPAVSIWCVSRSTLTLSWARICRNPAIISRSMVSYCKSVFFYSIPTVRSPSMSTLYPVVCSDGSFAVRSNSIIKQCDTPCISIKLWRRIRYEPHSRDSTGQREMMNCPLFHIAQSRHSVFNCVQMQMILEIWISPCQLLELIFWRRRDDQQRGKSSSIWCHPISQEEWVQLLCVLI